MGREGWEGELRKQQRKCQSTKKKRFRENLDGGDESHGVWLSRLSTPFSSSPCNAEVRNPRLHPEPCVHR